MARIRKPSKLEKQKLAALVSRGFSNNELSRALKIPEASVKKWRTDLQLSCPPAVKRAHFAEIYLVLYKKGLTRKQIAEKLGITESAMWHKAQGLPRNKLRTFPPPAVTVKKIIGLYQQRVKIGDIQKKVHIRRQNIYRLLKANGVDTSFRREFGQGNAPKDKSK